VLWVLVVFALVFYGGGGWYFAEQLREDAFEVKPFERQYRATISAIDGETVSIAQGDPTDGSLFNPGVMGMVWEGGYASLSDVVSQTENEVTRQFTSMTGDSPGVGTAVDIDPWMYPDDFATALNVETEDVVYQSPLGDMDAVFIPGSSATWAILVHGKDAIPRETMRLGSLLSDEGYPVLAITHRNDAGQPGDPSGFHRYGVTEWEDLEGAVQYARQQRAERILLGGFSTGGAVILSFLENSNEADHVVGVVLDGPNIDFGATVSHVAARRRLPLIGLPVPSSLAWAAKTIGSWRFGVDWGAIDYASRAEQLNTPILILHGTEDASVPIETSRDLAAARPDLVTLVEFEGAKHIESWNVDQELYRNSVLSFLGGLPPTTLRSSPLGLVDSVTWSYAYAP
jgi:alpha-beta hydrolase superfamily lysophospholipase